MRRAAEEADQMAACTITYVELRAGLARARRTGRISPSEHDDLANEIRRFWPEIAHISVDDILLLQAGNYAEAFGLRAYDAMQLAALEAAGPPRTITFACWDRDLRAAAEGLGYELLPDAL